MMMTMCAVLYDDNDDVENGGDDDYDAKKLCC